MLTLAQSLLGDIGAHVRVYVTCVYFAWCGVEVLRLMDGSRKADLWPEK
jgi:hypothetical protein